MMDPYDVAVIGAGFAGVTAARDLSMAGHSVVLIEARERIGGRTWWREVLGSHLDMGGTYVHWTQAHIWRELRRYGIGLATPLSITRAYWLAGGAVHSGTPVELKLLATPLLERFFADARAYFPRMGDFEAADVSAIDKQTLRDRIDSLELSSHDHDLLINMMATLVGSETEQGLAQFLYWAAIYFGDWDAFKEVAGHWPIEGGTGRLINAMAADSKAEVRFSTPVAAIEDKGQEIVVTTRCGERIRARHAVVALPLNMLNDVSITPPLAQAVCAMIEQKHAIMPSKIWVRVKGQVEPFLIHAPVGKHPINTARAERYDNGDTLVVCFCCDTSMLDGNDRESVQRALRDFIPDIEVLETVCQDWASDPFSKGGWVHHRPGNLTQVAPLMRKPHGRIRFAGADIAAIGVGGIEGAIETGAQAASDIACALNGAGYQAHWPH
ncbi:flavin monoamine oxidase family protein [Paraburkholderia bannensis]|uniref:flavin monoamine oxidase family protein n=1 Tax=Paraburkholderia bannensis TaxID=765414 RepID=UPI002ABD714A|nr:NAD(P)/FAD-dependent oxidoreductase [Paraburkholderia bannensis]